MPPNTRRRLMWPTESDRQFQNEKKKNCFWRTRIQKSNRESKEKEKTNSYRASALQVLYCFFSHFYYYAVLVILQLVYSLHCRCREKTEKPIQRKGGLGYFSCRPITMRHYATKIIIYCASFGSSITSSLFSTTDKFSNIRQFNYSF